MRVLTIALTTALTSFVLALPALAADAVPSTDSLRHNRYPAGWWRYADAELAATGPGNDTRSARFAALETSLKPLAERAGNDWHGSLRYRWQAEHRTAVATPERFGQFVDFKLGFTQRINPELEVGFRISATDQLRYGADAFHMLGDDQFGVPGLGLDRAFVHYTPEWAGTYEQADGTEAGQLDVVAGSLSGEQAVRNNR